MLMPPHVLGYVVCVSGVLGRWVLCVILPLPPLDMCGDFSRVITPRAVATYPHSRPLFCIAVHDR